MFKTYAKTENEKYVEEVEQKKDTKIEYEEHVIEVSQEPLPV